MEIIAGYDALTTRRFVQSSVKICDKSTVFTAGTDFVGVGSIKVATPSAGVGASVGHWTSGADADLDPPPVDREETAAPAPHKPRRGRRAAADHDADPKSGEPA